VSFFVEANLFDALQVVADAKDSAAPGLPVGENPRYVPSLAKEVRRFLPELRILLQGLAKGATRAQRLAAAGALRRHDGHRRTNWERTFGHLSCVVHVGTRR
jgi:hypothetical protein